MQDELEDNQEDYHYLDHEYWCDLLSNIGVKYNRKRAATQIKRIVTAKAASHYDSNESIRVLCKKRYINGVTTNRKQQGGKMPKHHGAHLYCVLYKNTGMPDRKYMSHISDNCFGKRSDQHSIKDGLGGALVNRSDAVK